MALTETLALYSLRKYRYLKNAYYLEPLRPATVTTLEEITQGDPKDPR
jgi:hypothetical protein